MMPHLPTINIQPGELYVARRPALLKTILGSCVGATFWSARIGAGALCHGILPRRPSGAPANDEYRYVDSAIRYLARRFDALGIPRPEIEVKLFGGADVLPVSRPRPDRPTVGTLNSRRALDILLEEGFTVMASDLGGTRGRTVHFNTGTGEVVSRLLARLGSSEAPQKILPGTPVFPTRDAALPSFRKLIP
jgi:chemotaxis protein CheD